MTWANVPESAHGRFRDTAAGHRTLPEDTADEHRCRENTVEAVSRSGETMTEDRSWSPAMCERGYYDRRPPVGALVAFRRTPWRVIAVDDVESNDWDDRTRDEWLALGMPDQWHYRPFRVRVESPAGGDRGSMTVHSWNSITWQILPEHYAVCVSCGELAPCLAHTAMKQAERAMVRVEREMQLMPGCCPACQEPITKRQESKTFPGENLLLPFGDPDVTFHMRSACRGGAEQYEEMWVRADPTRSRSLLTLFCEGHIIVHHDGSAECHGAPDCPTVYARHRSYSACYTQSHGCGRGCSPVGHPGCRIARPKSAATS